jgi:uncharacterized membrane protein
MTAKWRTELPIVILLVLMFAVTFGVSFYSQDRIPIHWNLRGEIDSYAGKWFGLFYVPAATTGLALLLFVMPFILPGGKNFESFARAWQLIRVVVVGYFIILQGAILWAATGHEVTMQFLLYLVPLQLGLVFAVTGNYLSKLRPNWIVGVRTPWTLSSKLSWTKTHRQASWQMMIMGAAIASIAIFQNVRYAGVVIGLCIADLVWLIYYSYLVWRNDPERIPAGRVSPANDSELGNTP